MTRRRVIWIVVWLLIVAVLVYCFITYGGIPIPLP